MGRRFAGLIVVPMAMAVVSGCVGATSRSDFDAEVQARGGGLSTSFLDDSMSVVADRTGVYDPEDLQLIYLSITPGARSVTAQVRDPLRRDFADVVVVTDGEFRSSSPVQDADEEEMDERSFRYGDLALDRVDVLADSALDAFAQPGGYVERITVRDLSGDPVIELDLSSPRRTATATFTANGALIGVGS